MVCEALAGIVGDVGDAPVATEIKIGKVKLVSGKETGAARVAVQIRNHDEQHRIVVRIVKERGSWSQPVVCAFMHALAAWWRV
jgi:hypothetical protein